MNKNKFTSFYCILIISFLIISSIVIAKENDNGDPDLCNKFEEKKNKWETKWENKEEEDKNWGDKWEIKRQNKIDKLNDLTDKFCDECEEDDDDENDDENNNDNDDNNDDNEGNKNNKLKNSNYKTINEPPIADTSAGEPYIGFINENILFNGSNSYDPDGYIVEFIWNFNDGTIKNGEIVYNLFNEDGEYEVLLSVVDNDGSINSTKTIAIIIKPNNPPSKPTINAKSEGIIDILYDFSVLSYDLDNDDISYYIDWGDGQNSKSQFVKNGTEMIFQYSWNKSGIYTISVRTYDGYTFSEITEFEINIGINTASILSEILLFIFLIIILISIYLLISHRNKEKPKKI
jgi:hypothetical protein